MRGNDLRQSEIHQYDSMFHKNTGSANNSDKKVMGNQQLLDYRLFTGQYELQRTHPTFDDSFDGFDETAKQRREQFTEQYNSAHIQKNKHLQHLQQVQSSEPYRARPSQQQHYKSPTVAMSNDNDYPRYRPRNNNISNQSIKQFNKSIDQIHLPAEMQRPTATRDQIKQFYGEQNKDIKPDNKSLAEQTRNNDYINSHQFMPLSGAGTRTIPGFDYYMTQVDKQNAYEDQF